MFHVFIPSLFSRYTSGEGLKGEVISVVSYKGMIYIGTLQGLYVLKQNTFVPVQEFRKHVGNCVFLHKENYMQRPAMVCM